MSRGKTKIENPFDLMMKEAQAVNPAGSMNPAAKAVIGMILFLGSILWALIEFMQYMDRVHP